MREVLWTSGTAFIIALVLTPIIRDIFHAYNVVDRPGFRKVHAYPIPRLGGISIGIAYLIALVRIPDPVSDGDALLWKLLPGAGVILLAGIMDDFFNLPAKYKLVGQIVAAAVAFWSGLRIETFAEAAVPIALSFAITVLWLLLLMNALNLIDGLDGLCAGMGFFAAAALYAVALVEGNVSLEHAMLPLIGALLGFLFYNFKRATMFLGDSGALLIGYLIGCGGIIFAEHATPATAIVPIMASGVPLLDVVLSVARRFLTNRPIFMADRGHIHHRLLDAGLRPPRAVVILYLWAAAGAVFAFLAAHPFWRRWQALIVLGFCATAWAGARQLRYSEFTMAAKLLFGGEFRKIIAGQERIRSLSAALEQSRTEDEWWALLVATAREAGWVGLLWTRDHSVCREQVFPGLGPPAWSFSLTFSDNESLQIQGTLQPIRPPFEIMDFAQAVRDACAARRPAWERSGLS
jgi:UDP-GlcNAc:undecaprenyl-phosphate GlcNAc-1-phosphate transferase